MRYRLGEWVKTAHGDGVSILLNTDTGVLFSASGSGPMIIAALEQEATRQEVVEKLGTRWNASPERLEQDVARFIDSLLERGLCTALPAS